MGPVSGCGGQTVKGCRGQAMDVGLVPGRSAWGCNSPPPVELTTVELSPDDSEGDTSVRIGDRPASHHRRGTRSASPFRFLLLGCTPMGRRSKSGDGGRRVMGLGLERRTRGMWGYPFPATERQSVSSGELRGVLHALQHQQAGEKMVFFLDSEYLYKGITEWSSQSCHSRRLKLHEVGHRDLWDAIFQLRQDAGALLKFI